MLLTENDAAHFWTLHMLLFNPAAVCSCSFVTTTWRAALKTLKLRSLLTFGVQVSTRSIQNVLIREICSSWIIQITQGDPNYANQATRLGHVVLGGFVQFPWGEELRCGGYYINKNGLPKQRDKTVYSIMVKRCVHASELVCMAFKGITMCFFLGSCCFL